MIFKCNSLPQLLTNASVLYFHLFLRPLLSISYHHCQLNTHWPRFSSKQFPLLSLPSFPNPAVFGLPLLSLSRGTKSLFFLDLTFHLSMGLFPVPKPQFQRIRCSKNDSECLIYFFASLFRSLQGYLNAMYITLTFASSLNINNIWNIYLSQLVFP